MKTLTVLIPVYNEERTIVQLISQLSELPLGTIDQCIFVDDGSTDNSVSLITQALNQLGLPYLILKKENGGKASAIKHGAKHLSTSHVVILDSDLELATSDIAKLWEIAQTNESDFVFGYRKFLSHSSFTWRYSRGNQLISNLYGLFFNEVITDIMCGYKLIPSEILKQLPYKYKKFGLEIEIPMHMWKSGQRPYEVEVSYRARSRAEGKSISVIDALFVITSMVTFRLAHRRKKC
jgi:glycosyltransferase involved in cell wall biosynthesis